MTSIKELVDLVIAGENIFISGSGGTGKSFLLKELYAALKAMDIPCALTATTGSAAVNVGGVTLHSWAGVRLGDKEPKTHYADILKSRARKRWLNTKVLLVDEVSMLGQKLFDKLDVIGQWVRMNEDRPFGGLQLVFCGDMCQLPPINDEFVFKSKIWNDLEFNYLVLEHPWRFQNDIEFFYLLQRVRKMELTQVDITKLENRKKAYYEMKNDEQDEKKTVKIKPTRLFSKRLDVDKMNKDELDKLPGKEVRYIAKDAIKYKIKDRESKLEFYQHLIEKTTPSEIVLKSGAQVILTWNLDLENGLCNGSRGVVVRCNENNVEVYFKNGQQRVVEYNIWTIEDDTGIFARSQLPLILGWSYTIHRAQGQTLDAVIVDLGTSIFSDNMAYVALSRCRDVNSLYIVNLDLKKLTMDKDAMEFERNIRGEEDATTE